MEDRYVEVAGLRLRYVERGGGAPLVYVHGNTGSSRWFERVMDIPGWRTVALDMPNFGLSAPLPGEVDIDRYADVVAGFVAAVCPDRPVLVGHSLGGAVAISLAVRRLSLLRALVLLDSASPAGLSTPVERHPLITLMRTNRDVLAKALAVTVPTLGDRGLLDALVDDAMRMAAPAWIGNAEALGRFDYRGKCAGFTAPVLVVWGRKDPIITEAMARETAAAFPRSTLEILETVGHAAVVEDPAGFTRVLSRFLAGIRTEGA